MSAKVPEPDANDVRTRQREEWTAAATGWAEDREPGDEAGSPVTLRLLELARIREGDAVLDMACGSGEPAFAIARLVGGSGRVVGLDVTRAMIDHAGVIARALGVSNVEFRAIDDECDPGVERAAFDAVTCRYGLMYMPNPQAAMRAWRQALRPRGRIAVCTWAALPLLQFVLDVIARHAPIPRVDPEKPGALALSAPEKLTAVLQAGGFAEITVETLRSPVFEELPPEQWWDLMARSAGPLVIVLASLPEATRNAIRADGLRALGERHPSGIVAEFGDALLASGINPA
jgi:SAM-dependent methyltransferase